MLFSNPLSILLAEDDIDDCLFFEKALSGLELNTTLNIVKDGEELMEYLSENSEQLPDILFLDLKMPRKNGFESLSEIRETKHLKHLHVVIFATATLYNELYVNKLTFTLYEMGADNFVTKRGDFLQRQESIHQAIIKALAKKAALLV